MTDPMPPDFLAIGHVAKDLSPGGHRIGGAVTYAALTARNMGLTSAVVTSVETGLELRSVMPGIPVHIVPSDDSTTFQNTYDGGRRAQIIKAVGGPITATDIPLPWRSAPLVLLGPLAGELSGELARCFPDAFILASIQGWLRQWDQERRVSPGYWEGMEVLPHVAAAICSIDDVGDQELIEGWKDVLKVLIVTRGEEGAGIHFEGEWHHIEAFPACEVDATGAGDVFAAAYMIRYQETLNPLESARFASCAASFCVEADGVDGIPTRTQVEEKLMRP